MCEGKLERGEDRRRKHMERHRNKLKRDIEGRGSKREKVKGKVR